jgi:uncharacterized protein YdeI (YjbR/CyaY-like superfamily)
MRKEWKFELDVLVDNESAAQLRIGHGKRGLRMSISKQGPRLQIMQFKSSADYRSWLAKNCEHSDRIWLRIYKKGSTKASITYAQALDQSLCYGWIDGQKKPYDQASWLQKFTPRRAKSGWSKINTQHAERLIKSGEMTPAGLEAINAAKADGRWKAAYDSPGAAAPPDDFLRELNKNKKAKASFETLNKRNTYAIVYRLQTAQKPETRAKRMKVILAMLVKGEKFHS